MNRFFKRVATHQRVGATVFGLSTAFTAFHMSGMAPVSSSGKKIDPHDKRLTIEDMRKLQENGRLVVSYKGGVFDVTDFTGHPGGVGRIQMVSGEDLEPFWRVYTQHNRGHVVDCVLSRSPLIQIHIYIHLSFSLSLSYSLNYLF